MWELVGDVDEHRFLVIAHSGHDQRAHLPARPAAALGAELRERLIVYGALAEPEGGEMSGVAFALRAPGKDAAVALLREGATGIGAFPNVEVHDWELGGRR
jgi:hypothetical protein